MHLVPHWQCVWRRVLKLAVPGLFPLWGQTQQCETSAFTRRALFTCALEKALLPEPHPLLAFRFNDDHQPLGTISGAAVVASLAWGSRRRQSRVKACSSGQNKSFQAVRVSWRHRRRASFFCHCHHRLLEQGEFRNYAHSTLGTAFCTSAQCFLAV